MVYQHETVVSPLGGITEWLKKVSPISLLHLDFLADFIPNLELLLHDLQRGYWNVHGRVSARVRRGNDGHDMRTVFTIAAWIPHGKTKLPIFINGTEHHRVRPVPLAEDAKEHRDQRARRSIRVGLKDTRNHHSAIDLPEITRGTRANASSFRPLLHTP